MDRFRVHIAQKLYNSVILAKTETSVSHTNLRLRPDHSIKDFVYGHLLNRFHFNSKITSIENTLASSLLIFSKTTSGTLMDVPPVISDPGTINHDGHSSPAFLMPTSESVFHRSSQQLFARPLHNLRDRASWNPSHNNWPPVWASIPKRQIPPLWGSAIYRCSSLQCHTPPLERYKRDSSSSTSSLLLCTGADTLPSDSVEGGGGKSPSHRGDPDAIRRDRRHRFALNELHLERPPRDRDRQRRNGGRFILDWQKQQQTAGGKDRPCRGCQHYLRN